MVYICKMFKEVKDPPPHYPPTLSPPKQQEEEANNNPKLQKETKHTSRNSCRSLNGNLCLIGNDCMQYLVIYLAVKDSICNLLQFIVIK